MGMDMRNSGFQVKLTLVLALSLGMPVGFAADKAPEPAAPKAGIATVHANNQFGYSLLRAVARSEMAKDANRNIFISPVSAALALQMLLNGAGKGSTTYLEISKTLGVDRLDLTSINQANLALLLKIQTQQPRTLLPQEGNPAIPFTLTLASSVWNNSNSPFTFNPSFVSTLQTSYQAEAKTVNFSADSGSNAINYWAAYKTDGKIKKVIDAEALKPLAFVMMNATYFKANWQTPFDSQLTATGTGFTRADGTKTTVEMMSKKHEFGYAETSLGQAMELPYMGDQVSMVIILPKEGRSIRDAVTDSDGVLSQKFWQELQRAPKRNADFYLPKFQLSYEVTLNDSLQSLGMGSVFTNHSDLTNLGSPPSKVSLVKQDSFIKLDEEGTEAAAVTTIGASLTAIHGPTPTKVMRVDRPFLVSIVEKTTGSVLFMGVISDPKN